MLSDVGICKFYENKDWPRNCRIKEKVEDFIVQEVVEGKNCQICTLLDFEKYKLAEELVKNLPKNLSKMERKKIYEVVNYHPIKQLITVNNEFEIRIDDQADIFVFTLIKYNYGTNALLNLLSKRLSVNSQCIQIAGTKDKRAITFQEISVKCNFAKLFSYACALNKNKKLNLPEFGYSEDLDNQNKDIINEFSKYINIEGFDIFEDEDIKICNIRRGSSKKLGDLDGNRFTIKIRGMNEIKWLPKFFINYFGQQRFGIHFNNHIIGEKILQKRYDDAINMILEENGQELDHMQANIENRNSNRLQQYIIKMKQAGNKNKYIINSLARNIRMTYLHAYQSYKFNLEINRILENSEQDKKDKPLDITNATPNEELIIPLEKMDDKLLKGGQRKIIETIYDFEHYLCNDSVVVKFFLKKSCYATMALRELIGDEIIEY